MALTNSEKVISSRKRRKILLAEYCGNKCCICGYNKTARALEFHHISPKLKSYSITASGVPHKIEDDFAEVEKCILVCANCHREIEDGLYAPEDLLVYQVYNKEIKEQALLQAVERKQKTVYHCVQCGETIPYNNVNGLCKKCYSFSRRVVAHPSREELKDLIRNRSFISIGEQYGVSDKAISKWCKNYNLPSLKKEIKLYSDEEWESL